MKIYMIGNKGEFMNTIDDIQIINLLFESQESGLVKMEEKYKKYCYSIANRIVFDNEDAKECVNDTWLKTWNSIPPNRPENLAGYLAKIVRNLALNCYERKNAKKRGGGQVEMSLDELSECVADSNRVEENIEKKELVTIISNFLQNRDEKKRTIFIQRYFYMEELCDIADRMQMKESSVRSVLSRMRKDLRKYLEEEGIAL